MFEKLDFANVQMKDVNGDFLLPIPKGCKFTTEEVSFAPGTRLAIIPETNSFSDEVMDFPFVFCIGCKLTIPKRRTRSKRSRGQTGSQSTARSGRR